MAPSVIEDIVADPERYLTPHGDQRELSVMFLDVRRFSTITEKMAPAEVIGLLDALDRVNVGFRAKGLPEVSIGIGINTGLCSVGNMGSTRRLSYSCVGDPVNLASRLEGLTK